MKCVDLTLQMIGFVQVCFLVGDADANGTPMTSIVSQDCVPVDSIGPQDTVSDAEGKASSENKYTKHHKALMR